MAFAITGRSYRLLTEAEWEYAARAGSISRYSFGDKEADLCRYSNGADRSAKSRIKGARSWPVAPCSDGYAYTSPVGAFAPNSFGLYDMGGNVGQWTEDCYHDSYAGAPVDGSAWTSGDCTSHVVRGGNWHNPPRDLRSANRERGTVDGRGEDIGFRIARSLTP